MYSLIVLFACAPAIAGEDIVRPNDITIPPGVFEESETEDEHGHGLPAGLPYPHVHIAIGVLGGHDHEADAGSDHTHADWSGEFVLEYHGAESVVVSPALGLRYGAVSASVGVGYNAVERALAVIAEVRTDQTKPLWGIVHLATERHHRHIGIRLGWRAFDAWSVGPQYDMEASEDGGAERIGIMALRHFDVGTVGIAAQIVTGSASSGTALFKGLVGILATEIHMHF